MRIAVLLLLASFIILQSASAATIYGNIYDISLEKVKNVEIEINTVPKQFMIASNGLYSFNVPNGQYTIKASQMEQNSLVAFASENVTVRQEGQYVIDIIIFPQLESGLEEIDPIEINESILDFPSSPSKFLTPAVLSIVLILLTAAGIFIYPILRKKIKSAQKPSQEDAKEIGRNGLEEIVGIIEKEGGRTTQKEIRKQMPLSEAKISLMIAELEHKGKIEKIKKGRGNIIILKK